MLWQNQYVGDSNTICHQNSGLTGNLKKEATQEATVIAGILNKETTGNGNVIFSKVGGGVFRPRFSTNQNQVFQGPMRNLK